MIKFDHMEAHVSDIKKYCEHLKEMFQGGDIEVLNEEGISMFTSPDGFNVEIKKREENCAAPDLSGFCCPCLRMNDAKSFIEDKLGYDIVDTKTHPAGYPVYFFYDYEKVLWHIKDIPGEV